MDTVIVLPRANQPATGAQLNRVARPARLPGTEDDLAVIDALDR